MCHLFPFIKCIYLVFFSTNMRRLYSSPSTAFHSIFCPRQSLFSSSLSNMTKTFILSSLTLLMMVSAAFGESTTLKLNRVSVIGSNVVLQCNSSFAPPWARIGPKPGQYKSLFVNGRKHPNLNDERISFSNNRLVYKVLIKGVLASDAGTYVCDGDQPVSYILNVIR